ncbi:MAG: hypothetical protein HQ583_03515, partial [Candidatus Abyssubacteria bacterium]|nr:hypothetical protein [Candidatus Abyssubacteria bacterium]
GLDDDGDGSIDEDPGRDQNGAGEPGISGFDDDDDGSTDEGSEYDDDEDGQPDEDPAEPIVFYLDSGSLMEDHPLYGTNVLAGNISQFRVQYVSGANGEPYIDITLSLGNGPACTIELNRVIHVENILQRQGMRL